MAKKILFCAAVTSISLSAAMGCTGSTPANEMPPPEPGQLTVYYPVDFIVYGRGGRGSAPAGADCIYISAHPADVRRAVEVDKDDGSFTFSIPASSNDVLELAGFALEPGDTCAKDYLDYDERGGSVYVQIPQTQFYGEDFKCCKEANSTEPGVCVRPDPENMCVEPGACYLSEVDGQGQCGGPPDELKIIESYRCNADADCSHFSQQNIPIATHMFAVSAPDELGRVAISGLGAPLDANGGRLTGLPPNTLLQIENRQLPAETARTRYQRQYVLTDEDGNFTLEGDGGLNAKGDDELVVRLLSFGSRSRELALYVPDASLKGLDILGLFAFEQLKRGATRDPREEDFRKLAVRFAPYGLDDRGMCPDSGEGPALCFSGDSPGDGFIGGLDYDAITITNFEVDGDGDLRWIREASVGADGLPVKYADGDILAPPQTIALILDNSEKAYSRDPRGLRFEAAKAFIRAMRARDEIMVWIVEDKPQVPGVCGDVNPTLADKFNGFRCVFGPAGRSDTPERSQEIEDAALNALQDVQFDPNAEACGQEGSCANATEFCSAGLCRRGGEARLFEAVEAVGQAFRQHGVGQTRGGGSSRGKIFMLAFATPAGSGMFEDPDYALKGALDAILPGLEETREPFSTFIVSQQINGEANTGDLRDLAVYSKGQLVDVTEASSLSQATGQLLGQIAGAFVLLYDVYLPPEIEVKFGKSADITVEASLRIRDSQGRELEPPPDSFTQPVEVAEE